MDIRKVFKWISKIIDKQKAISINNINIKPDIKIKNIRDDLISLSIKNLKKNN